MKDLAIGMIGLDEDEYYSMTMGNFKRRAMGHIRNTWTTAREMLAMMASFGGERVTGEDIFPFGIKKDHPRPTEEDREYMRKRHENTLRILNGRR